MYLCMRALGPVGWSIGPWSLALGVPLAPWCPPGPCPWPLAWALVLGYVSAGASFSVWRRVLLVHMLRVNRLSVKTDAS